MNAAFPKGSPRRP